MYRYWKILIISKTKENNQKEKKTTNKEINKIKR